jgi:predicted TPR repeat methyltransferase
MNNSPDNTLPASYFEAMYSEDPDPWNFETSEYEAEKYEASLAALPRSRYASAFEIGGSIGVLTKKLAGCCDQLLSVDLSKIAQAKAVARCQRLPQVSFEILNVPTEYPDQQFDLIVVSEVGYYWSWADLEKAKDKIVSSLNQKAHLLLVHWLQDVPDYPLTGDDVHDSFLSLCPNYLRHCSGYYTQQYRLDLFERV